MAMTIIKWILEVKWFLKLTLMFIAFVAIPRLFSSFIWRCAVGCYVGEEVPARRKLPLIADNKGAYMFVVRDLRFGAKLYPWLSDEVIALYRQ